MMKELQQAEVGLFWDWIRERYQIYLRRQAGLPKPWTNDLNLQWYKATNNVCFVSLGSHASVPLIEDMLNGTKLQIVWLPGRLLLAMPFLKHRISAPEDLTLSNTQRLAALIEQQEAMLKSVRERNAEDLALLRRISDTHLVCECSTAS